MNLEFKLHSISRNLGNGSILKYRDFDGYIVSAQNSGTQWFKYLMSCAIAHKYELPIPEHTANNFSNDFIGHPKHQRKYSETPKIASTHQIPHYFYDARLFRLLMDFPKSILLTRDIRHALVSNYEKWKDRYNVSFSEYLKGDISEKKYVADIWWFIRFYNRWGRVIKRYPEHTHIVRYEDLKTDTFRELAQTFDHLGITIDDASIEFAISESSKEKMSAKTGETFKEGQGHFVRKDNRDPLEWYSNEDMVFFKNTIRDNLKFDFGYPYL